MTATTVPTSDLSDHDSSTPITAIDDVVARYRMPGPHLTVIVRCPPPGSGPSAADTRWHAHEVQLRHRHGPSGVIERMAQAYRMLPPTGDTVLLTANHSSVAHCVLHGPTDADRDAASVGRLPRLIPAVAELQRSEAVVGVLVDRVGADIHVMNATEIRRHETVVGEDEFVHKGAPGGWSQHRFQTRAEQVWKRNSGLVARRIAKLLTGNGLHNAVVSGDVRAVGFLLDQLPASVRARVEHVQAGGRHEPESPDRLKEAAKELAIRAEVTHRDECLERLHDPRAVIAHGIGQAIEPLMRGTVQMLFVTDRIPPHDWLDFAVQRALEADAEVVIVPVDESERIGSGDLACVLRPGPAPSVPVP